MTDCPSRRDGDVAKLEKILSTHSLDGLVFQKRERKQTSNNFLQIPSTPTIQKVRKQKIKQKREQKNRGKKIQKKQKTKKIVKKSTAKKAKIVKKEQKTVKKQNNKKQIIVKQQIIEEEDEEVKPKIKLKLKHKRSKKIKKIGEKSPYVQNQQGNNCQRQEEVENVEEKDHQNADEMPEDEQKINLKENQEEQMGQQQENQSKQEENKHKQKHKNDQEQMIDQQQDESNNRSQKSKKSAKKTRKRQEILLMDAQIGEGWKHQGRKLRERKAIPDPLKQYNALDNVLSQEENQEIFYEGTYKKKTNKIQKEYHINRIFRKCQKVEMPSVELNVDIEKISFEQFAQKFGNNFQMIHFSLPLDMLASLPKIQECMMNGFIFIWVQKGEIQPGYHHLNRLGYDVIDQVMWVKTNESMNEIVHENSKLTTQGTQLFQNCRQTCLVGYKCSPTQRTEYCTKISNNIIFSSSKPRSIEKPDQIYQIADLMMPGAKKLQIGFKKVGGWLTLKHQQSSFTRCFYCLRKQQLKIRIQENHNQEEYPQKIEVVCVKCLIHKNKSQQQNSDKNYKMQDQDRKSEKDKQKMQIIHENKEKYISIKNIVYNSPLLNKMKCYFCENVCQEMLGFCQIGEIMENMCCLLCFKSKNVGFYRKIEEITIFYCKKAVFSSSKINCVQCSKKIVYQYYLQSTKGKITKYLCSNCMQKKQISVKTDKKQQQNYQQPQQEEQLRHQQKIMKEPFNEQNNNQKKQIQEMKDDNIPIMNEKENEQQSEKQKNEEQQMQIEINQQLQQIIQSSSNIKNSSVSESRKRSNVQVIKDNSSSSSSSSCSKQKRTKRRKNENQSEWRLRSIIENPQMKTICSNCRQDCFIPYYGCQICQNWYWCGKCKIQLKQHHSHFRRQHNLHLII